MAKEKPQVLKGMRDFLPQQMIARNYVIGVARRVFESFGFEPLDTPSIEYAEVLMGKYGPEADRLLYSFEDRGGRRVGLRYDLTVPLARFVASHPELTRPFKRYQIGNVWRGEAPQEGRYREFTQCDVDIVGAPPPAADAEVAAVFYAVYHALGLDDVLVRLNHRQLLASAARVSGVPDPLHAAAFRGIDKLDKAPVETVKAEMAAAGIEPGSASRLLELTGLRIVGNDVSEARAYLAGDTEGLAALDEMARVIDLLDGMGVPTANYLLDLSLARGLDYYTGPIVEATLPGFRSSVGGGGRYDNLVGMFGAAPVPTVGASVGLDRIVLVLEKRGKLPAQKTVTDVLVTVFNSSMRKDSLSLAAELRQAGLMVETFLLDRGLGKQFAYADTRGIPYAIVLGPDELAEGTVSVKDLVAGDQVRLSRTEIADHVRRKKGIDG